MAGEPIIQTSGLGSTFNALRNRNPQRLEQQHIPVNRDYKSIPNRNLAPTSSVHGAFGGHMTRQASATSGGGIVYGQPQFFSPVHTPINWQIPSKRLEIYQWCFVEDTPVLMSNGLNKCIQDIEVNEYVMSHKGEIKRVIDKGKRIVEEDIVYLDVAGLKKTLKTTINHEICVIKKQRIREHFKTSDPYPYKYLENASKEDLDAMLEWVPSVAIQKGDYVLTPVLNIESGFDFCSQYTTFDSESEKKIFKDLMFVLGLYVAEGCFSWYRYKKIKRPKGLRFCINKDESKIIERLKDSIKNICGKDLNIYNNGDGNSYDIHVYDKNLALFVHSLVFGTAKNKNIDEDVLYAPKEGLIEFLTGYISGDGHINCNNSYIDCVTASEVLVENLSFILMRLNIPFRIYPYTSKCKRYNGFHLVLDATKCKELGINKLGYEFSDYEATSKSVIPTKLGLMRLVNKIDFHYYSGFVYNIEVEDHKSYIANFIGVHNSRFFYENEPKVASSMDFYSYFPMNDYDHECKDRKVKKYFDKLKNRLGLAKWCRLISHEIHLLGDCFPFVEVSCDECGGQGRIGEEICEHEGGTIKRVVILNPDYVEVLTSPMNPDPIISMRPDEELINMVQKKTPGYEKLAPNVRAMISSGRPIRLDNRNVSHLKYGESGYSPYGVGMVRRLFPILSYKTKLMVAQWIVAERLIVPIKIVKVGTEERPAGPADIAAVQAQLAQTANDPNLTIVTHHAFELDWIGASGKVLTLSNEFDFINQEILDGMMINNALLNGEGPNFSAAAVGIEAMIERLETFRREIAQWIEEKIYLPEAIRQGFIDEDEDGEETEYIYPRVKWNSMHLRDQQQYRTFLLQLYEKGLLSAQTVLESFDLDPDQEIERKRYDAVHMLASQQGQQGGMGGDMGGGFGGMGGGGGGGMPEMPSLGGDAGLGGGPGDAAGAPIGPSGGMAGAGGAPPMAATKQNSLTTESSTIDPSQYGGKILKQKTREKINSDREKIYQQQKKQQQSNPNPKDPMGQMRDDQGRIVYTKNEMRLMDGLTQNIESGLIKYPIVPQFHVKFGSKTYSIDFAIPNIKIGLEADGEAFHSSPKQITHDKERDQCLGQMGWTIMRFTDEEIEDKLPEVMRTIIKTIMDKELSLKKQVEDVS